MARMIPKQIRITVEQERLLKRRARESGLSEAELIRRGIDMVLAVDLERRRSEAWASFAASMEERARLQVPQEPRTWTRDELYDRPYYLNDGH